MKEKRAIEIFSAGCPICKETINRIKSLSCPSCEITVLDMHEKSIADRAKKLGIRSIPAVVIDGNVAGCCVGRGVDEKTLIKEGLGLPLEGRPR